METTRGILVGFFIGVPCLSVISTSMLLKYLNKRVINKMKIKRKRQCRKRRFEKEEKNYPKFLPL